MSGDWYLARNRQKTGPFSKDDLARMAASGDLKPEDVVLQSGAQCWVPASTLTEFFPSPAPAPEPVALHSALGDREHRTGGIPENAGARGRPEKARLDAKLGGFAALLVGFLAGGWLLGRAFSRGEAANDPEAVAVRRNLSELQLAVDQLASENRHLKEKVANLTPSSNEKHGKTVETEKLILRDAAGKGRIEMAVEGSTPTLKLNDENGKERLRLSVGDAGPAFAFYDDSAKARIELKVTKDGSWVGLADKRGKVRLVMVETEAGPIFGLLDEREKPKARLASLRDEPELTLFDESGTMRGGFAVNKTGAQMALLDEGGNSHSLAGNVLEPSPGHRWLSWMKVAIAGFPLLRRRRDRG